MFPTLVNKRSDTLGAISSVLCMLHCIATPFLFVATISASTCCSAAPSWWQWMDYIFLIVSFVAVKFSTAQTDSNFIKFALWISWIGLTIVILNANFSWFHASENIRYIPAFSLVGLHLYNLKYCQCKTEGCCQ